MKKSRGENCERYKNDGAEELQGNSFDCHSINTAWYGVVGRRYGQDGLGDLYRVVCLRRDCRESAGAVTANPIRHRIPSQSVSRSG